MNSETIRLEPSRFSRIHFETAPKTSDAPTRTFMLSPYDTPEAVVVTEDEGNFHLAIRYLFDSAAEPKLEEVGHGGFVLKLDPESGRINGLSLPKASAHGKRLSDLLQQLASEVGVPEQSFIQGGKERSMQFRRAVLPILLRETASGLNRRHSGF
jgi:hypothetical protein